MTVLETACRATILSGGHRLFISVNFYDYVHSVRIPDAPPMT